MRLLAGAGSRKHRGLGSGAPHLACLLGGVCHQLLQHVGREDHTQHLQRALQAGESGGAGWVASSMHGC